MKRIIGFSLGLLLLITACTPVQLPAVQGTTPAAEGLFLATTTASLQPVESPLPEQPLSTTAPAPTDWQANAGEIFAGQQPVVLEESTSPDGRWKAEVQRYECVTMESGEQYALEQLFLTELPDGEAEMIEEQPLVCQGLGAFGLGEIDWSENGRYLYYTTAREGSPDGGSCGWFRPLIAYELTGGQRIEISEGIPSPTGNLTATPVRSEGSYEIILWDKEEGDEYRLEVLQPGMAVASIAWREDGEQLVYLLVEQPCGVPGSRSLLVRYNLTSEEQDTLLDTSEHAFVAVEWPSDRSLLLRTASGESVEYDLSTFSLMP